MISYLCRIGTNASRMGGKLILTLVALVVAPAAMAGNPQDAYFCTREGAVLHYVRTSADDGSLRWNHIMTIDSVKGDGPMEISYNSLFTKPGGRRMYAGPVALKVSVTTSGDVHMDVAQAVASVFSNLLGAVKIRSAGAVTVLPASMAPGDVLPDASGAVKAGPASIKVEVTDRKVLRLETLTTPAGTFDCIVVQEHKVEKGTFRNRVTTARTWYARGVGMVRHDTYDRNMELETTEVLARLENL